MRYTVKITIASVAIAAVAFGTAYIVQSMRWSELALEAHEARRRGGGPTLICILSPAESGTAFALLALVAVPVVLLSARGVWQLCTKQHRNDSTPRDA